MMKIRLFSGVFAFLLLSASLLAGMRDAQWREVDEATQKGLPKTAIAKLEPIISGALADRAYAEAIRAICQKIALESSLQGGKAEEKIVRLQDELEKAPAAMRPAMEAVLANWYWQYFQQNRWRFLQRTATAGAPGPDLLTWDLARILAEIDRHFSAALAADAVLKAAPIAHYNDLLDKGTAPDIYRPTLFDFLAYQALQFYQAGEQGGAVGEDDFEISATSPIFADAAEFLQWKPQTTDTVSGKLKAIGLYQALLAFHQADADRAAFSDADLARLKFGHNVAVGETKEDRYKAALERLSNATTGHEVSSRALAALAQQFYTEGDFVKALEVARRGNTAVPQTEGGAERLNLISQIEAKSAGLDTEHVWNAPWPTLNVTYQNVTKVYFRAVAADFSQYLEKMRWGFNASDSQLNELLASKPTLEWDADLPPTTDYKPHTERLLAPTSLKLGFYVIIASYNPTFSGTNNQVSAAGIWVSELALVLRTRTDGAASSGFVLKAKSGEPITGATVRLWERDSKGHYRSGASTKTDEAGQFQFARRDQAVIILAEQEGDAVSSQSEIFNYYNRGAPERTETQSVIFTDRALYRPGQTINYKGVSIRSNREAGKYSAVAGHKLTVLFSDRNGQEIARASHTTNDYGSFNGVFTAPRERLMGAMSLRVVDQSGMTSFNVEEYKRPKFQVELKPPAEAAKLDASVVVTGKATAYTGAAIGGAKVKWRVERHVQLPLWCWWWQPPAAKSIAHGTAKTEADGTFKLQFVADPDRAVPAKNEPTFVFSLHADVTDTTGETRSDDRRVLAGYTALKASLTADEWETAEKPVDFAIKTQSLDGDPQSTSGTLTIHALKQPLAVERASLHNERFWWTPGDEPKSDSSNPDSWELADRVAEKSFTTDAEGKGQLAFPLKTGVYRASLETKDRFGKTVTARQTLQVVDPRNRHYGVKLPNHFASPKWTAEPGETFTALWGTGYETGRAFVELECNGKPLKGYWTTPDHTQALVEQAVTEEMRGGFTVRVTSVRENRAYLNEHVVAVPWSNKQFSVKWESFRSKLSPGQKETWTAVVTDVDAKRMPAELVATLYDASLDQYKPLHWPQQFSVFRQESSRGRSQFQNDRVSFQNARSWDPRPHYNTVWSYRIFSPKISAADSGGEIMLSPFSVSVSKGYLNASSLAGARSRSASAPSPVILEDAASVIEVIPSANKPEPEFKPDLSKISARKNLSETAFFFPHILAGEDGVVKMEFTLPEALTEWKFLGFAHDKSLRAGLLTDKVVTSKDLMVEPNPPRFVREGDVLEFTVKVSNQTDRPQHGKVKLTFADAASQKSVDEALANRVAEQSFDVPAKQARSHSWRIAVPDGMDFLTYKAVAATEKSSDGEEGFLPVLSRRVLVTESLPLPIRGKTTEQFEFKKLLDAGSSPTLRQQSLTVQMVSQPAWYAVMALPYLMEYPYECSEQVFNRLYANALARHIAHSDPKIRRIFDLWKNTPSLDSPLEKNQDLKSVMLEETPWLRQAKNESQSRKNVGLLFDVNRLDDEASRALRTLTERQLGDGLWSWFPGGRSSEYMSLYITTGFGRLKHLGVEGDWQPALKSLAGLDEWMNRHYQQVREGKKPEEYVPSEMVALYLYGRSFFLQDQPIAAPYRDAVDFFLQQSRKFWIQVSSRQSQAHLALALQRFGDKEMPRAVMNSLKERSINDAELGMYWRDPNQGWWWYAAPIETQALMIEAFAEVVNDVKAVEDCKVWLLKQKQTQAWPTTKATADAIYGLLLRGQNLLSSDARVEVSLAGALLKPDKVELGTGFYEQKFVREEIKPAMGRITVRKTDEGVSWGSIHWQYLEDIAKVTPHEGTPLTLKKTLFIKETTAKGQVLKPVTGPISVGDELVVRLELRTDREMEFVHLKDQRGSGTEPVDVLSRYHYEQGLGYYETTRDTASHFFIDSLGKGVYVFEYSIRVQLKGHYQTGIAEIQCMYAPEFNSHSESIEITVN